ncbi:MAG: hypothetical protein J6S71_07285 [Clostridia bacterium]|nr:hypothetical protein [Clostridia bacterium]
MSEAQPDLGAMVSKLLDNPDLLSQIASTVGVDLPKNGGESPPPLPESAAKEAGSHPAGGGIGGLLPMLTAIGGNCSRRTALLNALKPFCNEHRCRTIDYMISISKLSDSIIQRRD